MKTMKLLLVSMVFLIMCANLGAQKKPFNIPDEYKTKKNPIAMNDASTKAGAVLYQKNCAQCHGKTGLGDGVKARALKTFPGDFSKADYQDQSDGEHFYETKFGNGEMPKYEGKLSDDDMWNIVNFTRTLKK
jgi:mono/diheme cytochrome c family protein